MRFQAPTLAIGLLASLALASEKPKISIETLFDGPGDDAKSICALKTQGLCDEGPDVVTSTEMFAYYDEKTDTCNVVKDYQELGLCGKNAGGFWTADISVGSESQINTGVGTTIFYFRKRAAPYDTEMSCQVDALTSETECTPEKSSRFQVSSSDAPPPPTVTPELDATPTPSASVAVETNW